MVARVSSSADLPAPGPYAGGPGVLCPGQVGWADDGFCVDTFSSRRSAAAKLLCVGSAHGPRSAHRRGGGDAGAADVHEFPPWRRGWQLYMGWTRAGSRMPAGADTGCRGDALASPPAYGDGGGGGAAALGIPVGAPFARRLQNQSQPLGVGLEVGLVRRGPGVDVAVHR